MLRRVPQTGRWEIRRLAEDEVERVGAVLGLARLNGEADGFYIVAWEGEEAVGHAHLALTDPPELQDVEVRPAYRRRGVATALTEAAEREVASRGFDRLRVTVDVQNQAAKAVYKRCGYAAVGVPPRHVRGRIMTRTGPIDVDATLLTWEKRF
jgi:ribosomal protein S18 acetylase RimI-like enzyme